MMRKTDPGVRATETPIRTSEIAVHVGDTFAKIEGAWLFAGRLLYVDWLEERLLS